MPWAKVEPVFNVKIIGLCGTPYHAHPHGCHNFCKRSSCPPTMPPLSICLDDFYLIWIKWPIGRHVKQMLKRHPGWTIYQAQNVLYWQAGARKILQGEVDRFLEEHPQYAVLGPKEHLDSWGIDIRASIAQVGIHLKWGPSWGLRKYTYVLRYAGMPIEGISSKRRMDLERRFPVIYQRRTGLCKACKYRPCLKYMTGNPHLYVKRRFGSVVIERFMPDRGWVVRCNCGRRKIVPLTTLFCKGSICACQGLTVAIK
jgi:hypothetical protein